MAVSRLCRLFIGYRCFILYYYRNDTDVCISLLVFSANLANNYLFDLCYSFRKQF